MSTTFEYSIILLCRCNNCRKLVTLKTRPQNSTFFLSSRCPNCNIVGSIEKITREQLSESLLISARPFLENSPEDDPHINIPNPYIYIRCRPTSSNYHNTEERFDCYYDNGSGFGFTSHVQPAYLATSEQVFHQGISKFGFFETSKTAIALIPSIEIQESHVSKNPHCSVCLEPFDLETKAKEIPVCKHLYHPDCILPWLELHDSCPLCRRHLSSDDDEEVVGLVVWRLGGDMVGLGRFSGGERIFDVIFKEPPDSLISRDFRGSITMVLEREVDMGDFIRIGFLVLMVLGGLLLVLGVSIVRFWSALT